MRLRLCFLLYKIKLSESTIILYTPKTYLNFKCKSTWNIYVSRIVRITLTWNDFRSILKQRNT